MTQATKTALGNIAYASPFIFTLALLLAGMAKMDATIHANLNPPSMADCHGPAECDD